MISQSETTWREVKLGDICRIKTGKTDVQDAVENGAYPLFDRSATIKRSDKFLFDTSAIILPGEGAEFTPRFYEGKFDLHQRVYAIYCDEEKRCDNLNLKFLYYFLFLNREYFAQTATGATVKSLRLPIIADCPVTLPPFTTQKQITGVLSTYDDLIENNTRRIQILEQMAQAIYMEWFVNFRFPGHEKVIMIDSGSDFGKIPEGWEIVKIGDIADFMNGFAFKPKHLNTEGLPVIKIPELRSGILNKTPRNSGESIPKKYLIKTGDILFSWSATLLVNIWNSGDGLLNQHLFKVTPKNNNLRSYVFYLLTNQIEKYRSHAVGATMQHLRRDVVLNASCLLSDEKLLTQFEEIASNILREISALTIQNANLRQSRDLLLPKLVTGEIQV